MPNIIKSDEVARKMPFLIQNHKFITDKVSLLSNAQVAIPSENQKASDPLVEAGQVLTETKILSEQLLHQAQTDAGRILQKASQEASKEAETIKQTAQKDGYAQGHEQGTQHGHDEGYRDGYQQGLEEGTAAARQEMADKFNQSVKQAEKMLLQAEEARNQIVLGADRQIIELALAVASKVLAREIEENPLIILPIVTEALEKVRDQAQLVVRVNPIHYSLLLEAKNDLQRMIGGQQEITILSDPSLGEADCLVETGNGTVDARLETQMTALRQRLEELVSG